MWTLDKKGKIKQDKAQQNATQKRQRACIERGAETRKDRRRDRATDGHMTRQDKIAQTRQDDNRRQEKKDNI